MHVNRSWTLDCRSKGLEASHPAFRAKSINIETEPMSMLFDSIKIGRLDEEAQPSAYPRRRIIKAGGAIAGVAMKTAAAPLQALDEQQVVTVRDRQRRSMMP